MKKKLLLGLISGVVLLLLSVLGLFCILWLFPNMAMEYFGPAFIDQKQRNLLYYVQPFVMGPCLLWLWFKLGDKMKGSTLVKSLKFGLFYMIVASLPYMLLIYSAMDVSSLVILSWLLFGFTEAFVSAVVFSKIIK